MRPEPVEWEAAWMDLSAGLDKGAVRKFYSPAEIQTAVVADKVRICYIFN
jgi:hypothetical protein